jgi:hypothetical protein
LLPNCFRHQVRQSAGSLADRMLTEWVRAHLLPKTTLRAPATTSAAEYYRAVLERRAENAQGSATPTADTAEGAAEPSAEMSAQQGAQEGAEMGATIRVGTVLLSTVSPVTGRPADRVLLEDQFLHKAILLVLQVRRLMGAARLS